MNTPYAGYSSFRDMLRHHAINRCSLLARRLSHLFQPSAQQVTLCRGPHASTQDAWRRSLGSYGSQDAISALRNCIGRLTELQQLFLAASPGSSRTIRPWLAEAAFAGKEAVRLHLGYLFSFRPSVHGRNPFGQYYSCPNYSPLFAVPLSVFWVADVIGIHERLYFFPPEDSKRNKREKKLGCAKRRCGIWLCS